MYEWDRSHGTLCFWILKASFLHQCPSKPTFEDDGEPNTVLIKLCPVFSASRTGGELPEGVVPHPNGTLDFGRPLSPSDGGTYTCVAKNEVGEGKAEVEISVAGRWQCCQRPALRLFRVTHETKKKCWYPDFPLYRGRTTAPNHGEHADDHGGRGGRRAADHHAHHCHHPHLPP